MFHGIAGLRWSVFIGLGLLWSASVSARSQDCAGLTKLKLEHASVTAEDVVNKGGAPSTDDGNSLPEAPLNYCRVQVTSRPTADSDIRIEVWIPLGTAWNGKFEQVGNGGFAGSLPYRHMQQVLGMGYAVAGTDDGHRGQSGVDASWALNHPEKIQDYGWRAIAETTLTAKRLVRRLVGTPSKSYFVGCSDGGREALMMAQRYPTYFDGIVAGAPAYAMTRLLTGGALRARQLSDGVAHLSVAQLALLQRTALQACGKGATYLTDPRQCHVDLTSLQCEGATADTCLSPAQVQALHVVYADAEDPASGGTLYGVLPGAEAVRGSWDAWLTGSDGKPGAGLSFTWNYLAFMVMNDPKLDMSKVTEADIVSGEREYRRVMDADSADLSTFKARGGRLIQYHGWNDPGIAPGYSLEYRERLQAKTAGVAEFYRLYMVPGMLHCGGGDAPTNVDWQAAIEAWVERAQSPAALLATDGKGATQTIQPFN